MMGVMSCRCTYIYHPTPHAHTGVMELHPFTLPSMITFSSCCVLTAVIALIVICHIYCILALATSTNTTAVGLLYWPIFAQPIGSRLLYCCCFFRTLVLGLYVDPFVADYCLPPALPILLHTGIGLLYSHFCHRPLLTLSCTQQ